MNASSDPFAALRGLRIGCVRYLNARPLIDPYDGPVLQAHPSELADGLRRGDLDVGLVPVFEALRMPECVAAEGVAIASRGPVWSVILAYQGPLSEVRQVALDPASRTSVHLCKVFFAERGGDIPEYVAEPAPPGAARVIIGNQAIAFREKHEGEWNILDFGEEWLRRTGLPFVFAVWLIRPEVKEPARVAEAFREISRRGQAQLDAIVARHREHHAAFARRYLTEYIRFGLGAEEKEGIERFRALLCKHNLLPPDTAALRFV
ncbi:MAG: menaquinone biosynthesis protein [Chthoniobacteraceae bacterium]|nr:menaquinone biosynthesis protein [Chthoniobacteraceae bacterium]